MMNKDFKGQNLQGMSFERQDLTGADFSNCDVRGVNFSWANLTDARFCKATMGRTKKADITLQIVLAALGLLAVAIAILGCMILVVGTKQLFNAPINSTENMAVDVTDVVYLLLCAFTTIGAIDQKKYSYILWFMGFVATAIAICMANKMALENIGIVSAIMFTILGFLGAMALTLVITFSVVLIGAISGAIQETGEAIYRAISDGISKIRIDRRLVAVASMVIAALLAFTIRPDIKVLFDINKLLSINDNLVLIIGLVIVLILGAHLGLRAIEQEDSSLSYIRKQAQVINRLFGVSQFTNSNLKGVDFSEADLAYANFKHSNLSGCRFWRAKNHHLALTDDTPIFTRKVRELVVNGEVTDHDLSGLNLQGLDFSGLDLQNCNFSNSNVSFANFSAANLMGANLSEVTALGTVLNDAQMTGACIQNWNIDTRTELRNIRCSYVYLAANKQDRSPPEDEFAPDEFSKLYQKVANTIDFIVHSHGEYYALINAIHIVKLEAGSEDIFVQNIERKENSIVVKIKAPPGFDREQIYKEVRKEQKKELKKLKQDLLGTQSELEQERRHTDLLADLLKDSMQRPVMVTNQLENKIVKEDNSRHQSVNGNTTNSNINFGDNSTLTAAIHQLPAEHDELKTLLSQLQALIHSLPERDKQDAIEATQVIAEAATQQSPQNAIRKTLRYFKGLAADLSDIPETAASLGVTAAKIALLFGL